MQRAGCSAALGVHSDAILPPELDCTIGPMVTQSAECLFFHVSPLRVKLPGTCRADLKRARILLALAYHPPFADAFSALASFILAVDAAG